MNLTKFLPLTETTFYILLALKDPGHGYVVIQLSEGKVRIVPGTMYGALDNLTKQKLIQSVKSEDARRKVYELKNNGIEVLKLETMRLKHLINRAISNRDKRSYKLELTGEGKLTQKEHIQFEKEIYGKIMMCLDTYDERKELLKLI